MKKNRAHIILKGTVSNYLRQVVQIAVFILLTPFIVDKVGKDDFGLWSLIQATVGLLGLMDLGFATSVVKYVADARGRNDNDRLGTITSTLFWIYVVLGSGMMLVAGVLTPLLPKVFDIPTDMVATTRIVFLLIALRSAQALPLGMFMAVLVGFQKQVLSNFFRMMGTVSYALVAWWALSVEPSIQLLAMVSVGTGIFWNLVAMISCLRVTQGVRLSPKYFQRDMVKEVSTFSLYFFLIQISLLIATRLDTVIIKLFLPLGSVALYSVAIGICEKASVLCRQLANALTPVIAELKGAGEEKNIRAVLEKGTRLSVGFAAPLLLGLFWYTEDLLVVWMGEEFREATVPCRFLLCAAMVSVIHTNAETVLTMTGHQRYLSFSMLAGQGLNVILTVILIQFYGIAGVALATFLSVSIVQLFFVQRRIASAYNFSFFRFYRTALLPSVPGIVIMLGFVWVMDWVLKPSNLLYIAILEGLACLVFVVAFFQFGMTKKEREYYSGKVKSLLLNRREKASS